MKWVKQLNQVRTKLGPGKNGKNEEIEKK